MSVFKIASVLMSVLVESMKHWGLKMSSQEMT